MSKRKTVQPGVREISPVSIYGEVYGGKDLRRRCVLRCDACKERYSFINCELAHTPRTVQTIFTHLWYNDTLKRQHYADLVVLLIAVKNAVYFSYYKSFGWGAHTSFNVRHYDPLSIINISSSSSSSISRKLTLCLEQTRRLLLADCCNYIAKFGCGHKMLSVVVVVNKFRVLWQKDWR